MPYRATLKNHFKNFLDQDPDADPDFQHLTVSSLSKDTPLLISHEDRFSSFYVKC